MIKLYCISIFLQQEKINDILHICNEHGIGYQEIEITDQVNETGIGYQISIDNLKILLLPCNDFHTHKDFEIGITVDTKENWTAFIENLKRYSETEYGQFADDGTEYALIKDDALHGPFFFIFDGHYSNIEPLIRLRCTIREYDYVLYKKRIEKLLSEDILKRITVQSGAAFCMEEIIVKNNTNEIAFVF